MATFSKINKGATHMGGVVVQVVHVKDSTGKSTTSAIPFDTSVPLITEGGLALTLAVTPTNASNILQIDWVGHMTNSNATQTLHMALFNTDLHATEAQSTAFATQSVANGYTNVTGQYRVAAGTTSPTTFTLRYGAQTGSTSQLNQSSSVVHWGVAATYMTITEIQV